MRDIKFRCYVKFLGEMHEVREMILGKGTVMIEAYPYGLDRDDAPVMQYIGMKDKNGVDIYEGDIVYIAGFGNSIATLNTIFGLEFVDCLDEYRYRSGYSAYNESDIGEVLGNIYQDKHLLT